MVHGIGPACDLRFRSIIQCGRCESMCVYTMYMSIYLCVYMTHFLLSSLPSKWLQECFPVPPGLSLQTCSAGWQDRKSGVPPSQLAQCFTWGCHWCGRVSMERVDKTRFRCCTILLRSLILVSFLALFYHFVMSFPTFQGHPEDHSTQHQQAETFHQRHSAGPVFL